MRRWATAILATVLPALPALAAEGDFVSEYGNEAGTYIVREWLLCDGDKSDGTPPNTCTEIDLQTKTGAATTNKAMGMPAFIVADIRTDNCDLAAGTGNAGFLRGFTATGGAISHNLNATIMEGGTTTSSVTVNPVSHRFINFAVTTEGAGGSCNDFEVVLRAFYIRAHFLGTR